MNDNDDKELFDYICVSFLNLRARFEANEVILNALLETIIGHAPELIEPLKERMLGVSEIQEILIKQSYTSGESAIFNEHLKQCMNRFQLIQEGSKFISKKISVVGKSD